MHRIVAAICGISILSLSAIVTPLFAQRGRTATDAEINRIMLDEVVKQNLIGVAVGVIENGRMTYSNGFGYADLGRKTKMTNNSVLRWASISKTVTAVAIMQLREDKKLSLTDKVSDRIGWPKSGRNGRVTIDHLLQNRSGLHHYGKDTSDTKVHKYNAKKYDTDGTPFNGASAIKAFDQVVDYEPGTVYNYTTFGFNVLGAVVDELSPEGDYVRHVERRIASKLGATFSVSRSSMTGYTKPCDGILALDTGEKNIEWKLPGGGWQSNIKDLAKFAIGLMNGSLIDNTSNLWNAPSGSTYRRGISRRGSRQNLRVWHGGSHDNAATVMHLFPNRNIGVVIMSNTGYADVQRIARRIYREAFGLTLYNKEDDVVHGCVETKTCKGQYSGVWRKTQKDVVFRRGYNTKDFQTEWDFLRGQGYQLEDIETYRARNSRRWDGVFKKGTPGSRMTRGLSFKEFGDRWRDWKNDGFQVTDIETYVDGTKRKWAGVFRKKSGKQGLFRDLSSKQFGERQKELAGKGYKLIDIETYRKGSTRKWAAVWTGGPASLVNRGYSSSDFGKLRNRRKAEGWKLIDVEVYGKQWAGVWERSNQDESLFRGWNYCGTSKKDGIMTKMSSLADNGYELIDWTIH